MYSRISSVILKLVFAVMLIFAAFTSSIAQQNKQDEDLSAPEAIALGILALGAEILASEIDKEFFKEAPAPNAPNNGQRIPSDPNNARDINAGEEWNPARKPDKAHLLRPKTHVSLEASYGSYHILNNSDCLTGLLIGRF